MAEKVFKVNEVIEIVYQAPSAESGLTDIIAEIFLPSNTKDSNFPDVSLVEIGNTGEYRGEFTPDQQGEWKVIIHKSEGDGQVVKRYSVGGHNVHSVGEAVGGVDTKASSIITKVDAIDTKVSSLDTPPMVS